MKTIFEALKWASSYLTEAGREENAAELLLLYDTGMDRSKLLASLQEPIGEDELYRFTRHVEMHKEGVPVQYIIGKEFFYGREFMVNDDVLIPRPETEEVVYHLLEKYQHVFSEDGRLDVVDVGTGSGAIAVTLALENKNFSVSAVDISKEALQVASANAEKLGADVRFYQGDLLEPFIKAGKKADIVVSNPPYISEEEMADLSEIVRFHEPLHALTDGGDGLKFYKQFMEDIPLVMKEKVFVVFEIGWKQGEAVKELILKAFKHAEVEVLKDINGKDRTICAVIHKNK
ncbi:peptide chain release factor N(5)-glutamine methyltransferase [Bacillus inaquosorum]|uniref:peptide chain release factor N(5)-glutamine methyltransferase n=1 Tax=Bacillus inaquosorum TaxID=483913 RepID=UPI002281F83B|nr:peptide chain release factor N(5)-glutamine methyltransferase [Bacillus inaquosorum]MCY7764103.1 peptide chain release factor N(5)-glutamine methyltransferase [Bacillus inaquosorum]MCY7977647.1 peptide chain release factor N(5)-glutamine methyltransferase [Bacillus inaquosorum]MCY8148126.1 peptide chain release factor N(5)-glutamine methyltransferase [Bacillus inaquosorum]MCY8797483.1 peptide chain release factor N(5)-glutamine methyltransferase [Bacillus inaquosorum]MCY8852273.1 peptide ch